MSDKIPADIVPMASNPNGRPPVGTLMVISDMFADQVPADMIGVVYRVVKHLRVNVEIEPVAGGRRMRILPMALALAPLPGESQPTAPKLPIPTTAPIKVRRWLMCSARCAEQYAAQGPGPDPMGTDYNKMGLCANCVGPLGAS